MANNKKITTVFVIYWVLLFYIIAALIWWFIALNTQSQQMVDFKLAQLQKNAPNYQDDYKAIMDIQKRKSYQYMGEGFTFLLLILAGAIFIYRSVKNQFKRNTEQYNFMMALTHELKTPIAVAALNLETIQKRKLDKEQQERMIHSALTEVNRLNTLCNNMLITSQLDSANYIVIDEVLDLSAIIEQALHAFSNRFTTVNFQAQIEENIQIKGDSLLLQIAFSNLLDNAVKYGRKNGNITIAAVIKAKHCQISIADDGDGIPVNERGKIFEKYYRLGNAATKSAKGTGLGLYLCKQIVLKHKGNIIVTDNRPQGANFVLTFIKG